MAETAKKEIERLRSEIRRHERLYYQENRPEISDYDFDQMMRRLIELERAHPELATPDSPSVRVGGAPVESFATVVHEPPMLSIENAYSLDELREWEERIRRVLPSDQIDYHVDLKIDGVSIDVLYLHGELSRGATRGDGTRGDDVTQNVKTVRSLPLKLDTKFDTLQLRGEIYLDKVQFQKINDQKVEEGDEPFANPRNAAAGFIRLKDSRITSQRRLKSFVYQIVRADDHVAESQRETYALLDKLHLPTIPGRRYCKSLDEVIEFIEEWREKRHKLDFEIDGIVVKVNKRQLQQELGMTSKAPRWAIAFKYPPEAARTIIRNIGAQVGRTGTITPVAEFDPVHLAGTIVKRATLHNYEEIARKDVRVGDTVLVEKGGEIIPKVTAVVIEERPAKSKPVHPPKHCPVCGEAVHRFEGEVAWRCVNQGCPAIVREAILHFASRKAMDIEGLGDETVQALFERGMLKDFTSLYELTADDLMQLEGWKQKKTANLLDGLVKSKQNDLQRFLFALGIRFVGERAAKLLAERFGSIEALIAADFDTLVSIPEIGPKVADSVIFYFSIAANRRRIEKLRSLGLDPRSKKTKTGTLFAGKTIVVTGTLEHFSRDAIEQLIEREGGKASGSVSSKTSFVVAGENAGSKLAKAQQLGVRVVSEKEFLEMVGETK